jgi:hypothetical protein
MHFDLDMVHSFHHLCHQSFCGAMLVKLELAQPVRCSSRDKLYPSLGLATSNCRRPSSNRCAPITIGPSGRDPLSTNARQRLRARPNHGVRAEDHPDGVLTSRHEFDDRDSGTDPGAREPRSLVTCREQRDQFRAPSPRAR